MNDAIPQTPEQVLELVEWYRKKDPSLPDPDIFVSYLISECGANRLPLKKLLLEHWHAAGLLVEGITAEAMHRDLIELLPVHGGTRRVVVAMLEGAAKQGELHPMHVEPLLEEWDARHFPNQIPEGIRKRAIRRYERANALFPNAKRAAVTAPALDEEERLP